MTQQVATMGADLYEPPHPTPLSPLPALLRVMLSGEGNLLSLLPKQAYNMPVGWVGYSRRSILIVNDPELLRGVLTDPADIYPKNDLMVGALEPLVGDSLFVTSGDVWRRQRAMIEGAFSHMRLSQAFNAMRAGVDAFEDEWDRAAMDGAPISLDFAMSRLTADIICRTVFSTSLESQTAKDVFESFTLFERTVAHVEIRRLIFDPPWARIPHAPTVLDACARIRRHLGELVDRHKAEEEGRFDDIAKAVIAARDPDSGAGFDRKQLIDQLGVFFLAGHETTASSLTWAFFILSQRPELLARLRREVETLAEDAPLSMEQTRALSFTKNVFREALRLYPPITFIPRVAAEAAKIGRFKVRRGAMIMIAPWVIHRHRRYWRRPDAFDPDRFDREGEVKPGTYLPFGLGPRVCVGAAFAQLESALILAHLFRRFDVEVLEADAVRPVARLTTRPANEIMVRIHRRAA